MEIKVVQSIEKMYTLTLNLCILSNKTLKYIIDYTFFYSRKDFHDDNH